MQSVLAPALRVARKSRGLTQSDLARRAALNIETVRAVEHGGGSIASFLKILRTLDLVIVGRNMPRALHIGASVALVRKRRGLSQRALARHLGISQPTLVALERHDRGRMQTLNAALVALGTGARLVAAADKTIFYASAATSSAHHGWRTPRWLLAALSRSLGRFDLDPCAPTKPAHRTPARNHFTASDDGLSLPWYGRVFLNPPYGRSITHWIAKALLESTNDDVQCVVALVPARTDTHWWHDNIAGRAHVWLLKGRLAFNDGDTPAPFPSAIVAWKLPAGEARKLTARLPAAYIAPLTS